MADKPDLNAAYAVKNANETRKLYADWAESYDTDFVTATGFRFPELVAAAYVAEGGGWPCLDVGCGTGALAARLPEGAVVDGLDFSPEMLAVADRKGLYRALIQADLTQPLDLPDASYAGIVSSGTFTHGHVGAEALVELVRVLRPGGIAAISIKPEIFDSLGFGEVFGALEVDGLITAPAMTSDLVYAPGQAPEGYEDAMGLIATFRRL